MIDSVYRQYDITRKDFNGGDNYIIKRHPSSKWYSEEYKEIEKDPELADKERSAIFEELEPLLGLDLTQGPVEKSLSERASELLDLRAKARANKDFVSSDRLRDELQKIGVNIRDTAEGQVWDIK